MKKTILLAALAVVLTGCHDWQKQRDEAWQATYRAWCKASNNTNLTYAEWSDLHSKHLLPGQQRDVSGDAMAGAVIGGMISSGNR
jgi:outer membrane lipoprotein SlyB